MEVPFRGERPELDLESEPPQGGMVKAVYLVRREYCYTVEGVQLRQDLVGRRYLPGMVRVLSRVKEAVRLVEEEDAAAAPRFHEGPGDVLLCLPHPFRLDVAAPAQYDILFQGLAEIMDELRLPRARQPVQQECDRAPALACRQTYLPLDH